MKPPLPTRPRTRIAAPLRRTAVALLATVLTAGSTACAVPIPGSSSQQRLPSSMPNRNQLPQPPAPSLPSPLPSPSSPSASLPSPSMPSPSLPSPSLPSPSLPSLSLPSTGGGSSGSPDSDPDASRDAQSDGQQSAEGNSDQDEGDGQGAEAGGWIVSNELPGASESTGEGDAAVATGDDDGEGDALVDALARALEELDGEILDERAIGDGAGSGAGADASRAAPPPPAAQTGGIAATPRPPLPPDRPDARDDDVVARQLREAAMAETDPELREDLWEEYRRYKSGL